MSTSSWAKQVAEAAQEGLPMAREQQRAETAPKRRGSDEAGQHGPTRRRK